ncbi:MAG TPA: F0F1 ATP synthase subunit B [Kiloniellaceae bacterium]|nr:F0F1 ATP synthase subunit B [Kiloniellaceae bacterium]
MEELLHSPTFWVAIAFVIFVALTYKHLAKAMAAGLDKRSELIRQELEEAAQLREEAQKTLADYKKLQSEAAREAEELIEHTVKEAGRIREQAERDLEAALKRREQAAVEKIAQAEAKAMAEVRGRAVDIAIAATGKLLEEKLDSARADAIVDQSIADLRKLH